jgi:pimeloyl-ACP methyl ester carboxylesterase
MITAPPSTSRHLRVRGLRFHLRGWGDPARPWVWLGTGWLDSSATFGPLVAGLLPDYHVVAPDWRGLGHSEWPADGYWFADYVADTEALIDAVQAPLPLLLVGHSMGAQVLSLYAGLRPERVRGLALLDGLMLPDRGAEQAPKRYRNWLHQLKAPRPPRQYESFDQLAERIRRQHPQLSADWAQFIARGWGAEDGQGRVQLLADPKHHLSMPGLYRVAESEAIWREITCPVLFLDAGTSLFAHGLPADEIERRRQAFADRRTEVLPEAGHMLHWDAPEATALRLRHFFSGI